MKTLRYGIWIIAVVMLVFIAIYFYRFNGALSDSKADWGTFGDYLSGVFSMFNLAVVVLLTVYVAGLDKKRSEREIEVQRRIILTQFRKEELEVLENKITDTIALMTEFNNEQMIKNIQGIIDYILIFQVQKKYLFPILLNETVNKSFSTLNQILENMQVSIKEVEIAFAKEKIDTEPALKFANLTADYTELRYNLISRLQLFILNDLKG